jgi:hypothetical protein
MTAAADQYAVWQLVGSCLSSLWMESESPAAFLHLLRSVARNPHPSSPALPTRSLGADPAPEALWQVAQGAWHRLQRLVERE